MVHAEAHEFREYLNKYYFEKDQQCCSFKFNERGKIGVPDDEFKYFFGDWLWKFDQGQFVVFYEEYLEKIFPKFLRFLVSRIAKKNILYSQQVDEALGRK